MDWARIGQWLLRLGRRPLGWTIFYLPLWLYLWADARLIYRHSPEFHAIGFALAIPLCIYWARYWRPRSRRLFNLVLSVSFLPLWQLTAHLPILFSAYEFAETITALGKIGFFFIGLAWASWAVDLQTKRTSPPKRFPTWNPFQLVAWYFGKKNQKLRQSILTLGTYSCLFFLMLFIFGNMTGCSIAEAPYGGGEPKPLRQVVKIQKVIRKNYVINPYSSILFNPPPTPDVELNFLEDTRHFYKAGDGEGEGVGFSEGTKRGMIRFVRLKYGGGDWHQDMDRGADLNLLTEMGVRLGLKPNEVNDRPEPRDIGSLRSFPPRKSPALLYMTGQQDIQVSDREIKILREYIVDRHCMLFGDNGGSSGWEGKFVGMMQRILPKVEPISVYLDHPIHQVPFELPKLPYVVKHGQDALGWVVDGRLVAYYHPGDIGDAWADGHSGVPREVWDNCYKLGINVIFYAYVQQNRWIKSTK